MVVVDVVAREGDDVPSPEVAHAILYVAEVCQPDDNPPIGIVLGAKKDELLMEYALQGITNQLFTARYQLYLPKREELQAQLDKLLELS